MKGLSKKLLAVAAGVIFCALCFGTQLRAEDMVSGTAIRPTVVKDFEDEEGIGSVQAQEFTIPEGQREYAIPLEMPIQGGISISVDLGENKKAIDWRLYEDIEQEKGIYLKSNKKEKYKYCLLDQKTYYLGIVVTSYPEVVKPGDVHITVKSYCFDMQKLTEKTDLALKSGKWVSICPVETSYMKVVFPRNGYIQVDINPMSKNLYGHITICSQKKKEYASSAKYFGKESRYGFSQDFAVKKGTYYLQISNDLSDDFIKLKYTFHADPSKKNYTMNKAITLKPNQFVTNVFYSDVKEATYQRWYKINVKNKKRLRVVVMRGTDVKDQGNYELCDLKGDKVTDFESSSQGNDWTFYTYDKVKPGTYYIRVDSIVGRYDRDLGNVAIFKWK